MTTRLFGTVLGLALLAAGCDLFSPRTPEPPVAEGGTYVQPSEPDAVVENVQAAVAELSAGNYRLSFTADFTFEPTLEADAASPSLWQPWGRAEEERYFSTLVAAARGRSGHELRLDDVTETAIGEDRYVFDATYVLTVNHGRPELPTTFQGRLRWELQRAQDNLWRLAAWTDREVAGHPSWSDLKAAFVQ